MPDTAAQRIAFLREEIRRHDYLYYVQATPEIGDREYDALYRELLDLEAANPELITPDSPSQRMHGAPADGFVTVPHAVPMVSLENTYNAADLKRFHDSVIRGLNGQRPLYVIEPKIDGISIALRYIDGVLTQAITRGNGKEGDDVTANIRTIPSVPLRLRCENPPAVFEARGECYMPRKGFQLMNQRRVENGEAPFANARNATAGSVKLLDPAQVANRPLDILFYTNGELSPDAEVGTQLELFQRFRQYGLKVQQWSRTATDFEGILDAIRELDELRRDMPYDTDGAVIKVNDFAQREILGMTAKAPCWAKAYKFEPERAETRLKAITIQVGRTGVLTPVAELEPVPLAGSTIARATLHNEDEIKRLDIRIGDTVVIEKAGEVIPAVIRVNTALRPADALPFDFAASIGHKCPSCGEPVSRDQNFAAWRCANLQCPAQNVRRLEYLAARNALDIEGVGGVVAEALCERGLVREPLDIFTLTRNDFATLNLGSDDEPRIFGDKNAAKVMAALENARTKPLGSWLQAMGIPEVGAATAFHLGKLHKNLAEVAESKLLKTLLALIDLQNSKIPRLEQEEELPAPAAEPVIHGNQPELFFAPAAPKQKIPTRQELAEILIPAGLVKFSKSRTDYVTTSIGPKTAEAILEFFRRETGKGWLRRMQELNINPVGGEDAAAAGTGAGEDAPLAGKTFVLTGTLTTMDRETASDKIRQKGGNVTGSVSRNTTYLVAGQNTGARKTEKAAELGVTVIDEEALLKMLE